jgi:hypothetical protein
MTTFTTEQLEQLTTAFRETLHAEIGTLRAVQDDLERARGLLDVERAAHAVTAEANESLGAKLEAAEAELRLAQADLEHARRAIVEGQKLAADRGEEVRGRGEDLLEYDRGIERVARALFPTKDAERVLECAEDAEELCTVLAHRAHALRTRLGEPPLLAVDASGVRLAGVPVDALNDFLKRHTAKAEAEAEPLRSATLGIVQELAALMVRHCAPPAAGLLGGTAVVEPAEPLNPGETPECGARPHPGLISPMTCTRPRGHEGPHVTANGSSWWGG